MEARFRKRVIIQEDSRLKIVGNITDDGTVVFFAIAESGPVSKGPNAIKNGFRQRAREPSPLSTKRGPAEEIKPLKGLQQTAYQATGRELAQSVARLF